MIWIAFLSASLPQFTRTALRTEIKHAPAIAVLVLLLSHAVLFNKILLRVNVVIYWGSEMRFISWGSKKRLCFQHKSHERSDQSAKYQKCLNISQLQINHPHLTS